MRQFLPSLVALLLFGCVPLDFQQRQFDLLATQADRQFQPSKRSLKKLFEAFDEVQSRDQTRARELEAFPSDTRWPELYTLYGQMRDRLERVSAYFPLNAASDYRGGYALTELDRRKDIARQRAGAYYLSLAEGRFPGAREGNKVDARMAYKYLQEGIDYEPRIARTHSEQLDSMYELGIMRIGILIGGDAYLADLVGEIVTARDRHPKKWMEIVLPPFNQRIDLEAELELIDYYEEGPTEEVDVTDYSEEVLAYVERQAYEERINDTTVVTKIREIEHYKTIYATAVEVEQELDLYVRAQLSVYDRGQRTFVLRAEMTGHEDWTNRYTECDGDRDALPGYVFCSGSADTPPFAVSMIDDATKDLVRDVYRKLGRRFSD